MYGATPKEEAAVTDWLDKLATAKYDSDDSRKALNDELTTRTFLVSDQFTAADVALYASLHPVLSQLKPAQYYATPALTRYFDHVQHLPVIASKSSLPQIPFDLENAPKTERKAPEVKKKDKKPAAEKAKEVAAQVVAPVAAAKEAVVEAVKGPSKEKKEKAPKEKKPAPPPPAPKEEDGPPVPSMIDLRVGKIVHVEKHPDADSLYVEQIDIGEPTGPRTVVSGLVNYVPIEQMQGAMLIAVCNLKPAKMRGVLSQAMVLCASGPGKSSVELLRPPEGAKPGDRVYFEGDKFESAQPLSQLNPKKKIFETVQPGFKTLENREAAWVDPESGAVHRIRTKDGVVLAPTLIGASLS
ncbi:nucleic acid-binding protein [Exidia glandulosa HHB12029]|uniref:Nucleic acid-binding protein n=1 Tax=Exidia glandulosa HHB12029 TaxID=1314781 RepID=A0A165M6Y3_EXIGL|nr:nucleic acid-binding protein [Exidia glandulosa HHB12029]